MATNNNPASRCKFHVYALYFCTHLLTTANPRKYMMFVFLSLTYINKYNGLQLF